MISRGVDVVPAEMVLGLASKSMVDEDLSDNEPWVVDPSESAGQT